MGDRGAAARRVALSVAAAGGLLIAGCTTVGTPEARPGTGSSGAGGGVKLIAALSPFDRCDDLLSWVKGEALARVQPWGLSGGGDPFSLAPATAEGSARDATATQPAPGSGRSTPTGRW